MDTFPHIKKTPNNEDEWFAAVAALARYLRGPQGCPWDRKQSSQSFAAFVKEEIEELMEAFESGDKAHVEEEFGDTLFCLIASAVCAEEEGLFTLEGALQRIHEKMIRRHDHVFGATKADTAEAAVDSWNRVKAEEKLERRRASREG